MEIRSKVAHLFVLVTILVSGCTDKRADVLSAGSLEVEQVAEALEVFHSKRGIYPAELNDLIAKKYLESIPTLPNTTAAANPDEVVYFVTDDGQFYMLMFCYDFKRMAGPSELIFCYRTSSAPAWQSGKYISTFNQLAADFYGNQYSNDRSYENLKKTIHHLIRDSERAAGCVNLFEKKIASRLGVGMQVEIPEELGQLGDSRAVKFDSSQINKPAYVVVFKEKLFRNSPNSNSHTVARGIYEVEPGAEISNALGWRLVAECK